MKVNIITLRKSTSNVNTKQCLSLDVSRYQTGIWKGNAEYVGTTTMDPDTMKFRMESMPPFDTPPMSIGRARSLT